MSEKIWRDDGQDTQHKYAVTKWELHYEINERKVDLLDDYEDEINFGTPTLEGDLRDQLIADLDALEGKGQ